MADSNSKVALGDLKVRDLTRVLAGPVASRELGKETVTPVCVPAYATALDLINPDNLYAATLLHGDIPEDWSAWLAHAGCIETAPKEPLPGDDSAILQAAVDGQDVALGRSRLVVDDLKSGRLVAPFGASLPASFAYWFVRSRQSAGLPALNAVEEWLKAEREHENS